MLRKLWSAYFHDLGNKSPNCSRIITMGILCAFLLIGLYGSLAISVRLISIALALALIFLAAAASKTV